MAGHMESKFTGRNRGPSEKGSERYAALEAMNAMYKGVTMSDLIILFQMDRKTIQAKLADIKPSGKRGQYDTYAIRDVAPYLVKPAGNIEEYIKKMRPNDLPPLLTKEYWNGQRAKQKFLEDEGDLWRTDKVVETMASVFKSIRMQLLLIPDALERTTTMTDTLLAQTRDLIDGALQGMYDELVGQFGADDSEKPGLGDTDPDGDLFYVPDGYVAASQEPDEFEDADDEEL